MLIYIHIVDVLQIVAIYIHIIDVLQIVAIYIHIVLCQPPICRHRIFELEKINPGLDIFGHSFAIVKNLFYNIDSVFIRVYLRSEGFRKIEDCEILIWLRKVSLDPIVNGFNSRFRKSTIALTLEDKCKDNSLLPGK
jgi:hypothetical protein